MHTKGGRNRPLFRNSQVFIKRDLTILKNILWTLEGPIQGRDLTIILTDFCVLEFAYLL